MALQRISARVEPMTVQTLGDAVDRGNLHALSQRKLNALGLPVAYLDRSFRYRFANRAFLDWLGKRPEEVLGREVADALGRDVWQLYRAYVEAALAGERTGFERQLATPGRPPIWIHVDYYPDRGPGGRVRGLLVTYSDVDHLKRLELEAGQREHRLRLVTDSVGMPILYVDRSARIRFANRPFADWIGAAEDDLPGHALRDVLPADAWTEMSSALERAYAGADVSYERRERKAGGELRWTRVRLFPDREISGRAGGAFVVLNDIEDDVRIRDALKGQQAQLRLFADNIPGPIAYLDRALTYTFVNQAFANLARRPQEAIYGLAPADVLPADVASFLRPILKRAQEGERVEYERIGALPDGEKRWMHGRVAPDLDASGKVRGLYCTEYDIHDLKLTEQALAAREQQLGLFTDNIPEPVVYLDADRRYVFVNEAFLRLVGLDLGGVEDVVEEVRARRLDEDDQVPAYPYERRVPPAEQRRDRTTDTRVPYYNNTQPIDPNPQPRRTQPTERRPAEPTYGVPYEPPTTYPNDRYKTVAPRYEEPYDDRTFSPGEIRDAGHRFFGKITQGLASVIEYSFKRAGRPTAYILGDRLYAAPIAGHGLTVLDAFGSNAMTLDPRQDLLVLASGQGLYGIDLRDGAFLSLSHLTEPVGDLAVNADGSVAITGVTSLGLGVIDLVAETSARLWEGAGLEGL